MLTHIRKVARIVRQVPSGGGTFARLLKGTTITVLLLFAVVVTAWALGAPSQHTLYLVLDDDIEKDAESSESAKVMFDSSASTLAEAFSTYQKLNGAIYRGFKNTSGAETLQEIELPGYSREEPTFRKILKYLTFSIGPEHGWRLEIDFVEFFEELYRRFGLAGRNLLITTMQDSSNCWIEKTENEHTTALSCWEITLQFRSDELTTGRIPAETLRGNQDTLAADIAVYVMRGMLNEAFLDWQQESEEGETTKRPFLLKKELPKHMRVLKSVTEGFSALPNCTDLQCLDDVAREYFLSTRWEQPLTQIATAGDNWVASLGLALVSHQAALSRADYEFPGYSGTIELQLWNMEQHLQSARSGHFIRWVIENAMLPELSLVYGSAAASPKLFEERVGSHLVCALRDYRRARWRDCINRLEHIESLPERLRPHFLAAKYDADFFDAAGNGSSAADLEALLSDLRERLREYEENGQDALLHVWPLALVYFRHGCKVPEKYEPGKLHGFLTERLQLRDLSLIRRMVMEVERILCWGSGLEGEDMSERGARGTERMKELAGTWELDHENKKFEAAAFYFEWARFFARMNMTKKAVEHVRAGMELPWAMSAVLTHPDFSTLDNRDGALQIELKKAHAGGSYVVEEACPERGGSWGHL